VHIWPAQNGKYMHKILFIAYCYWTDRGRISKSATELHSRHSFIQIVANTMHKFNLLCMPTQGHNEGGFQAFPETPFESGVG